ncbi:type II toxin-antitoxin system RelE/ParE family toxin [Leeuwenhoekiella sp. H156]|uniref:type II toxin-antitoxin system RelE/ParE family toxin n=1 Tax=Leeuwenhoekiella sp. H156 TaxID=3450128 RepID=UPI003FA49860
MALKIVWTPQAESGLVKVLEYLEEEWTSNEILNLEQNLNELLNQIAKYPKSCPVTSKYKHVHKGLVDKNNYIIYKFNPKEERIEIINFRGTRQKPLE